MPPYYQPNKHRKKLARLEKKRIALQKKLTEAVVSRPKPPINELCRSIGRDIARRRAAAGITQAKLSELVGTTQSVIGRIESGRHNLTVKKMEKIARALGRNIKITTE